MSLIQLTLLAQQINYTTWICIFRPCRIVSPFRYACAQATCIFILISVVHCDRRCSLALQGFFWKQKKFNLTWLYFTCWFSVTIKYGLNFNWGFHFVISATKRRFSYVYLNLGPVPDRCPNTTHHLGGGGGGILYVGVLHRYPQLPSGFLPWPNAAIEDSDMDRWAGGSLRFRPGSC